MACDQESAYDAKAHQKMKPQHVASLSEAMLIVIPSQHCISNSLHLRVILGAICGRWERAQSAFGFEYLQIYRDWIAHTPGSATS